MQLKLLDEIYKSKKTIKEITESFKRKLADHNEYQALLPDLQELKAKKKMIEEAIKADLGDDFEEVEKAKADIESNKILGTDMILDMIAKGESISEIEDGEGNKYEAIVKVEFKRI